MAQLVYPHPSSSHAASLTSSSPDDTTSKHYKLSTPLTTPLRIILIILTIASIAVWLAAGDFSDGLLVFNHILLWFLLLSNLLHLLFPSHPPHNHHHKIPCLPTILFQIGDCGCVFNGSDNEKKPRYSVAWVTDIILGIPTIVVTSIDMACLSNCYSCPAVEVLVLSEIVGALSIFVGLFSPLTARKPVIFEMGFMIKDADVERGGRYSRIRLPVDADDRRTAGAVSISA
ncbi:hypothetical protein QC762_407695 [Podospora pseudocomata]|uniref:MARVEL domain-containing protein n=1 Tax=Podospora pseudocomata TaxID=2093779 RepID=A0ABR0GGD3_9PEZI|nr:hypothetical protein QC762_407695 [Podospora pseudocomata]